jgi:hypothetical protein
MILQLPTLLAETHMAEVSLQYREDVAANGASGIWYLLIPVVAIAIGVAIYKIANRPPPIVNTPHGMLHEVCRSHRVGTAGRLLLDRIAEEAELTHPATMLLGVTQFEAAVEKAGSRIKYDRRQNATLGMLRRRLFA